MWFKCHNPSVKMVESLQKKDLIILFLMIIHLAVSPEGLSKAFW